MGCLQGGRKQAELHFKKSLQAGLMAPQLPGREGRWRVAAPPPILHGRGCWVPAIKAGSTYNVNNRLQVFWADPPAGRWTHRLPAMESHASLSLSPEALPGSCCLSFFSMSRLRHLCWTSGILWVLGCCHWIGRSFFQPQQISGTSLGLLSHCLQPKEASEQQGR